MHINTDLVVGCWLYLIGDVFAFLFEGMFVGIVLIVGDSSQFSPGRGKYGLLRS